MAEEAASRSEDETRTLVCQAGAILDGLGLVDYLGHCSARLPGTDHIVIKPKHSPRIRRMNQLTPADLSIVDLDGELISGSHPAPTEVFIHTEIYRARPDVKSVVHTHQTAATLMGVLDRPILPLLHVPASFVPETPVVWPRPVLVNSPELGRDLAKALGEASFCHLRGHGIVSVADDTRRATVGAIMLEKLAEASLSAVQAKVVPHTIGQEELETLRGQLAGVEGRWAYFLEVTGQSR
ncbi:class II aldolase/adducin family protein [Nocardiopsis nanhaiensis]